MLKFPVAVEQKRLNNAIKNAANGAFKGVLKYDDEELVSVDYNHSPYSSIFDATGTKVTNGKLARVAAWYDNEWGFSARMLDVAAIIL